MRLNRSARFAPLARGPVREIVVVPVIVSRRGGRYEQIRWLTDDCVALVGGLLDIGEGGI